MSPAVEVHPIAKSHVGCVELQPVVPAHVHIVFHREICHNAVYFSDACTHGAVSPKEVYLALGLKNLILHKLPALGHVIPFAVQGYPSGCNPDHAGLLCHIVILTCLNQTGLDPAIGIQVILITADSNHLILYHLTSGIHQVFLPIHGNPLLLCIKNTGLRITDISH